MAKVDFYILAASGAVARRQFACRLAEKAYKLKNRVHIQSADEDDTRMVDDLLWTFRDGSFVPHEVLRHDGSSDSPVTVSHEQTPVDACDLLINLTDRIPEGADSFPRVAEVVTSDDECKSLSRKRFAGYRDGGHELDTHNL